MIHQSLVIDQLQKVAFKEAKIIPGDSNAAFYLDVTYTFENLYGIYELHIPKINLKDFFKPDSLPNIVHDEEPFELFDERLLRMPKPSPDFIFCSHNGGSLILEEIEIGALKKNKSFEIKMIEEKEKEMTLEEIEKKLGHKVKIIAK